MSSATSFTTLIPKQQFSKDQRVFIALFTINAFMSVTVYSIAGPLYPPEATAEGLSPTKYGAIMAFSNAGGVVTSIFATGVEKAGLKFCFVLGTLLGGAGGILLGFVNFYNSTTFIVLSMTGFAVRGVGMVLNLVTSYVLCLMVFPTRISLAIGFIEVGMMGGSCFGPILSELIFTQVGYSATYILYGATQVAVGVMTFFTLPAIPQSHVSPPTFVQQMKGYWDIAHYPSIVMFVIILVILQMGNEFLGSMLEPAMRPFGSSRIQVGLTYLCIGSTQLLAPIWGLFLDRVTYPEFYLIGSLVIVSLGSLILRKYILALNLSGTMVALVICGFGQGLLDVAAVVNFQFEVKEKRFEEVHAVNFSFIGVLYAFATTIGGLLGPSLSGLFFDMFGFGNAMICICAVDGVMGLVLVGYMSQRRFQPRAVARRQNVHDSTNCLLID